MKTQIRSWDAVTFRPAEISWTLGLIAASIIVPSLLAHSPNNQWITGTLVNACLFLAAWRLPLGNALPVAILPSSFALMRGLLPLAMAPLVPMIILSNIILLFTVRVLHSQQLLGITGASMLKFLFLAGSSLVFFSSANQPLLAMLQLPQLVTALAGGLLALGITKRISPNPNNLPS